MFYFKRHIPLVAHIPCWLALLSLAISLSFQHAFAQDEVAADQLAESPQERDRAAREGQRIYRSRVVPNWIQGSENFWYRNDLPGGAREFVFVDVASGKRQLAFDHQEVAKALGNGIQSTHLPIERLDFDASNQTWLLFGKGTSYRWDSRNNALSETNDVTRDVAQESTNATDRRNGRRPSGMESSITFENRSGSSVEIFWLNGEGGKQSYGKIEPGASRDQHTFGGHRWQVVNAKGEVLGEVVAQDNHSTLVLDGRPIPSEAPVRTRVPRTSGRERDGTSPDGKWILSQQQHNLYLQAASSEDRRPLSKDGMEGDAYSHWHWSPDSRFVIAFRMKSVEKKPVHWIRSSPEGGGRALLESRPYVLPGDPFPTYELNLFRVESGEQIKPAVDRFEHEWTRPQIRFAKDGKSFTYQQTDRGHQRFRLIEIQMEDGRVRNIIDERTDTFIWTAHTENQKLPTVQWLDSSDELIYATEKNGWRQLLLIDRTSGNELRALTPQGIVVRSIESVDEANRLLWFTACGRDGQDPYLIHYGYVSLDTGKLTWLTEGDGHHTVQFSPSKRFMVDTYSRVDMAPVTELRRVSDGSKVCDLESSDVSELAASQWKPPEVFVAKGRDGKTDIWGIICRPKDFDPNKKYPVIEDIYAGPQGSFVPKTFSPTLRYDSLTRLGFIVVKIDGMGTANRSKAFHDVCWKNLKDGGFEDRILWMKAAAAKHPEMDLSRVGVYGTSAGGQNAAAAVLFHPEFYKVAVAACGCHDNRMDKASWNEQWMGYPVGPQYSECSNIDQAHRLQGKLFLIVGEMDTNVPPESTMRLADALIRSNKDFDLLVIPNGGHGMGGAYGQRRMHEYFVRHLLQQPNPSGIAAASPPVDEKSSSIQPPPDSFFELVRERYREKAKAFYRKFIDIGGLPVVASLEVDNQALLKTEEIVSHMLAGRPDILQELKKSGMYLIIIGKDQVYTDMPEYSDHPNPSFQNERVRGTGGKPTSFGEENLLGLALDRYDDESIGVHEFCHTIDGALRNIDSSWSPKLRQTFQNAKNKNLYEHAYAGSNAGEYWAEICQAYFDCNRVNNWNHGPIGNREQLKIYDPEGYELVRSIFRLTPALDWRYSFSRKMPMVEAPPKKLGIDPYYTKFCWARELTVLGREASDESLLAANSIVRKMFAYRHDILKALIASDVKIVVLGRNESLSQLPEIAKDASKSSLVDTLSRFLPYNPEIKTIVVSEENVIATQEVSSAADSHLIYLLADAIYQIAGTRPFDPGWQDRPKNIWQQYELRLERIDRRLDTSLQTLFEKHSKTGKWKGTQACLHRSELFKFGVLAYFNAVGETPPPSDSVRAIRTREDLMAYDPELYQIVAEVMSFDHHVDWRLR